MLNQMFKMHRIYGDFNVYFITKDESCAARGLFQFKIGDQWSPTGICARRHGHKCSWVGYKFTEDTKIADSDEGCPSI